MRLLLSLAFFLLSAWQTFSDWRATMTIGEPFRFSSVEETWIAYFPDLHAEYLPKLQTSTVPMLWDPVMVNFLTFPTAIVLFVLSALFWLLRKKTEAKKINYIE